MEWFGLATETFISSPSKYKGVQELVAATVAGWSGLADGQDAHSIC